MLWRCWLGGRKDIRPVKTEWWDAGVVVCLERDADLLTCIWPSWCHCHSLSLASVKSRLVLPFCYVVPAYLGSPGKRAVKRVCWCVCVCVCVRACVRACVCVSYFCCNSVKYEVNFITLFFCSYEKWFLHKSYWSFFHHISTALSPYLVKLVTFDIILILIFKQLMWDGKIFW